MNTLHLVSHAIEHAAFSRLISSLVNEGDVLLLIADAVSMVHDETYQTTNAFNHYPTYVLESDLKCRGLDIKLALPVKCISDQQWVDLACQSSKIISW